MTWQHIAALALGVGTAVAGALIPGAQVILFPVASSIIGGALGHMAQPANKAP